MSRALAKASCPLLAMMLVVLGGCGGSNSPTAPPVTTAPAPVSTVLAEGSLSELDVNVLARFEPFTTTAAGMLDVTVDWTLAQDNVEIYLAQGECSIDQVNQRTCPFAGLSESATAKPERIHIPNLAAGTYSLMIGNRGPSIESVSYQIVLTR